MLLAGAEWSLFWPGKGMAPDSSRAVIELLERPTAAAGPAGAAEGMATESAGGTDVSAAEGGRPPSAALAGLSGAAPSGAGPLSQALNRSTDRTPASSWMVVRMGRLSKAGKEAGMSCRSRTTWTNYAGPDRFRPCDPVRSCLRKMTEAARSIGSGRSVASVCQAPMGPWRRRTTCVVFSDVTNCTHS